MKKLYTTFLCVWISMCLSAQDQNKSENITNYIGGIYQKYISGIRGGSCPMYPSCSNYGLNSFKQGGVISGFLKTPDRLMRCGHEHNMYSYTYQNSDFKLLDPVNPKNMDLLIYKRLRKSFPVNDTLPDPKEYALIKELMLKEMYSEALIELLRVRIGDGAFNTELAVNYIVCLRALDKHEDAIFEYDNNFSSSIKSDPNINYEMAKIWHSLKNNSKELFHLNMAQKSFVENDLEYQRVQMLKGAVFASQEKYGESKVEFLNISKNSQYYDMAQQRVRSINELENIKFKKPALGAALGVIPGLGYLYAKHKQTALSAFILNSVLIYATYSNIKRENYGMASLTGIFAASFYVSSIVGSSTSVKRHNRKKINDKIQKIDFKY